MVGFPERSPCACVWMHVLMSVGQHDKSLGRLGAQQSLNSCIDVSTSGNKRLEVGLTINEAHGVQLLQLLLESHFRTLRLRASSGQQLDHLLHELLLGVTTPSWRGTGRRRSGGNGVLRDCASSCGGRGHSRHAEGAEAWH